MPASNPPNDIWFQTTTNTPDTDITCVYVQTDSCFAFADEANCTWENFDEDMTFQINIALREKVALSTVS